MVSKSSDDSVFDDFVCRLHDIVRCKDIMISNLFVECVHGEVDNRCIRLHVLKSDRNDRQLVGMLVRMISNSIVDYCIPRKKILKAISDMESSGSTSEIETLSKESRRMFTDIKNSGEGGELLLFVLSESVLKIPQVVSKMSIKTSGRMHYHGLDGVYVSCSGDDWGLRLHYGESKLHANVKKAVREAVKSIAPMLKDEGFMGSLYRDSIHLTLPCPAGC